MFSQHFAQNFAQNGAFCAKYKSHSLLQSFNTKHTQVRGATKLSVSLSHLLSPSRNLTKPHETAHIFLSHPHATNSLGSVLHCRVNYENKCAINEGDT